VVEYEVADPSLEQRRACEPRRLGGSASADARRARCSRGQLSAGLGRGLPTCLPPRALHDLLQALAAGQVQRLALAGLLVLDLVLDRLDAALHERVPALAACAARRGSAGAARGGRAGGRRGAGGARTVLAVRRGEQRAERGVRQQLGQVLERLLRAA